MTRAAEDRPGRGAGDQQQACDEQRAADDGRSRLADERRDRAADREADEAARVLAEKRHEAEKAHTDAEAKRANFEEVAPREQQAAERDESDRKDIGRIADHLGECARQPRPDGTAVEAQVEDGGEHEPEREQREAEQLVLVLGAGSLRPLLHARGDAWPKRPLLPSSSHDAQVLQTPALSSAQAM